MAGEFDSATRFQAPADPPVSFDRDAGRSDGGDAVNSFGGDTFASFGADAVTSFAGNPPTTSRPSNPLTTFGDAGAATRFPGMDTPATGTGGDGLTDAGFGGNDPSDHGPLNVGQIFGTRYHIIKLLGVGGMGAVYQAWDNELAVAVAIKVIRPEVMADPTAAADIERRFKRELLLARQVTHKNVVRIHDLGEIDGIKYITMAYVNGADLATLIRKQGSVPVSKTLRIARSVVSGLVAAHGAKVVHRDLKPANIMVDADDEALIMDFGIALSSGGRVAATGSDPGRAPGAHRSVPKYTDATAVGAIVGTVEYMAPEQAKGKEVDQRADVYAFGLILYDMLAGRRRAEVAGSAFEELQARIEHAPPPITSIVPEVPEGLDRIVSRCIEPDREKRFQSTAEVAAELDRLDENGEPIPIKRVVRLPLVFAIGSLLVVLSSGIWWYFRPPPAPIAHDPVSVVIADLQNNTGEPTLDRVLEPTLKRALETASFISAFDRAGISSAVGVRPPEKLDEVAARELAVKQGLAVVLSGSIERQGSGYGISIKAIETVSGKAITTAKSKASNKDQILGAAAKVAAAVREALGDDTSDSARQFAMLTLSTTSLEVVRHHAAAIEAQSNNKFDEALRSFRKAVELDPSFGIGYQGMASMSTNLGKRQDAERYINQALRHVDGMTERERYSTRGLYYTLTGDYKACVKEYGDLVARYPASPNPHVNRALCFSYLREMPKAVDEMRQAVRILPKRVLYRAALALYASYASDFQTAEREAQTIQEPDALSVLTLVFAQLGQGQLAQAEETYKKLGTIDEQGASWAMSGFGDLAVYEGRFSEAVRTLGQGAEADLTAKNPERAAAKFASLAYAHLMQGQKIPAVAAADKALSNSNAVKIRFMSARTYVEAGERAKAKPLIAGLANELQTEPQAYAKIVDGEIALKNKDAQQAIKLFSDANNLFDTWIGHLDLGRAYLEVRQFPQADSEFDRCINRRGEALALFLDEEPTYGYLPAVYYYQGRAREGMNTERFRESYRTYLNIRGKSTEDPLLPEIRRRAGE